MASVLDSCRRIETRVSSWSGSSSTSDAGVVRDSSHDVEPAWSAPRDPGTFGHRSPRRDRARFSKGLDLRPDRLVRVSDPGDVRVHVERRGETTSALIGDDDSELARDELGREVIGVGADAKGDPPRRGERGKDRPQVGDEAIVAGRELVELPAARDVLVLEALRFPFARRAERSFDDLFVDGGELLPRAGEEAGDHREAVRDAESPGRREREGTRLSREPIATLRARALSRNRPERIGEMLLQERDLGLDGELDVRERRCRAPVRRDTGQNPGASLLIHEAAGAIDGIDQDPEGGVVRRSVVRNDRVLSPSAMRRTGFRKRESPEEVEDRRLAHAVDGVDRVALVVLHDSSTSLRDRNSRALRRRNPESSRGAVESARAARRPS